MPDAEQAQRNIHVCWQALFEPIFLPTELAEQVAQLALRKTHVTVVAENECQDVPSVFLASHPTQPRAARSSARSKPRGAATVLHEARD